MGHDTGEFGFISSRGDGSNVDKHRSAWECKCIDFFLGNDMKLKWPGILWRDRGHQLVAELPNILRFGTVVGQDRHLLIDLGGSLQPERTLVFTGHMCITGIGELGTGSLRVGQTRKQEDGPAQPLPTECGFRLAGPQSERVMPHTPYLS